ncbi:cytochrome c oxidase subunit 3 [bacterium]|nr:cytochrome c oxidase subunit 3 [bacterium]
MSHGVPIANLRSATGIKTAKLATWLVIASEIVIFGGLLVSYLLFRLRHEDWADAASHTQTWAGAFNTFVLLTSSYFVVLAHKAAEEKRGADAYKYLLYTIGGGFVFMCVKAFEYTTKFHHGFTISTGVFWSFYFTATGLHGLHVLAGMVIMYIVGQDAKKNQNLHRVECIGIYWHFVDLVWIFLFPLLYIAK